MSLLSDGWSDPPGRRGPRGRTRTTDLAQPARPRPSLLQLTVPVLGTVALMWIVEIVDVVLLGRLDGLGIRPWSLEGLVGILFAPLLHLSFVHLMANTLPFIVMGVMIAWITRRWWMITAAIWILSGIGTWLIGGPGTIHLGASAVVYGYATFLVAYGVLSRRFIAILGAVLTVLLYGGIVWGVLPLNPYVSWQGHLMGAVAGVVVAFLDTRQAREDRRRGREGALSAQADSLSLRTSRSQWRP